MGIREFEGDEILAVLGRGIQRVGGRWVSSADLEMCDRWGKHRAERRPVDDARPSCLVGGGQLNVEAAAVLARRGRTILVPGYAHRSPYLVRAGGPSESEVMAAELSGRLPGAPVAIWRRDAPGPSNTEVEVRNVLALAARLRVERVRFVTVSFHLPRVLMLARAANRRRIPIAGEASELSVLRARPSWSGRIGRLLASRAYRRSLAREVGGWNRLTSGKYTRDPPAPRRPTAS